MDKIGLLTIHDTLNFGSQLQSFSLYKAVESLGCDVSLIDYKCEAIEERESTLPLKSAKGSKAIIKSLLRHKVLEERKVNFHDFMKKNMKMTEAFDRKTVHLVSDQFDTFLVGSDIVWGFNITGNDYTYMLDFVDSSKKKISFSSSVGTKWNTEEEEHVRKCLSSFDDIAVREEEAAVWISELIDKQVYVTCDPTMLWNCDFWDKLINENAVSDEKYVLVYMGDPKNENTKRAIAYGKKKNMPVYYINYRKRVLGTKDIRPTSIQEWLFLLKNADTVFTGSYHGLLFSLYFHKAVFYFNWANKSRMNSLAQYLGIENREGTEDNIRNDIPINYDIVDERIKKKREHSWNILKSMIL